MREKVRSLVEEKVSERVAEDRRSTISDQSTLSDPRDTALCTRLLRITGLRTSQ